MLAEWEDEHKPAAPQPGTTAPVAGVPVDLEWLGRMKREAAIRKRQAAGQGEQHGDG